MDVQQFFATLTDVPWLLTTLDLIGIFFFATSGALLAARKQFDLVGSLALSLLAGLGGGFTRDILLDRGLPASLENPVYLAPPVLVSLLVYVKAIHPNRLNLTITLFDAAGLALFTVSGVMIAHAMGVHPVSTLAHWLASLTPTGALAAAMFARGWRSLTVAVLTCLPWVVAGFAASSPGTSSVAGAAAFAPRAEGHVGTLGALLGLGGIWNGQAVPPSRAAGWALCGIALFALLALGWRAVPRRWLALAWVGFALSVASWAGLTAPIVSHVPGAGLLRDGQKWLILAIPAFVAAAGALEPRRALAAAAFAVLQVPDAPVALAALTPTTVDVPAVDHRGRDVVFESRPTLTTIDGHPVVDPAPKAMNVVESGALTVDGVPVDAPSPRWVAAQVAISDPVRLRELGIGVVVRADGTVMESGAPPRPLPPAGIALFALWCMVPLITCVRGHTRIKSAAEQQVYPT